MLPGPVSLADRLMDLNLQTSQLPQDDRVSISFKEFLAEIDVCMGGRVAEELSGCKPSERIPCFDSFLLPCSLWATERDIRSEFRSKASDKHRQCDGQGDELIHLSCTRSWTKCSLESSGVILRKSDQCTTTAGKIT